MRLTREKFRIKYPSDFFKTDNDLIVGNNDYEEGRMYYEEYSIDDFPSEEKIIDDLSKIIDIYNEYYIKEIKLFSEAIGATYFNNQYNLISVKPDWNDSTELLGYKNLNDEFI